MTTPRWFCKLCKYEWQSRLPAGMIPRCCPRCKRYDYDTVIVKSKQKTMVPEKVQNVKGGE